MSDSGWVRRMLEGDRAAGERFVSQHYPRVFRLLRCLTDDPDVAADLAQQTFTKAWAALASYRGEARLETWLHRIAYREYTHWLRDRRDSLPLQAAVEIADPRVTEGLLTIMVSRALAALTDDLRETFVLHYVQELSVSEVAAILEVPAGTVKSRLFTARQRLREMLDERSSATEKPASEPETAPLPLREVLAHELQTVAAKRESG